MHCDLVTHRSRARGWALLAGRRLGLGEAGQRRVLLGSSSAGGPSGWSSTSGSPSSAPAAARRGSSGSSGVIGVSLMPRSPTRSSAGAPQALQHLGQRDRAVLALAVLEQRDHVRATSPPCRSASPRGAGPPPLRAVADVQPARLEVGRVRGRGHLAVALLAGHPRLAVVLLGRRGAEVVDRDVDHAVGDPERLQDLLLDREQPLVLVDRRRPARRTRTSRPCRTGARGRCRACRARPRPPRGGSTARSRRSAAAARSPSRISPACSEASGTSLVPAEVQRVVGQPVDLLLGVGQQAGAVQRLLAHEHRRDRPARSPCPRSTSSAQRTSASSSSTRSPFR